MSEGAGTRGRGEWTPERIEKLKKLWGEGHSASRIADVLGGVTRAAVIGKVHRLGVAGRSRKISHAKRTLVKSVRMPGTQKKVARVLGMNIMRKYDRPALVTVDLPEVPLIEEVRPETLIPFSELQHNDHKCRWPFGEPGKPDFGFCGCASVPGQSYCPTHMARAWVSRSPTRWAHGQREVTERFLKAVRVVKMGVEG